MTTWSDVPRLFRRAQSIVILLAVALLGTLTSAAQQFVIGAYHLQSSVRVSATQYDYTYTADLTNTGATAHSVVGTVVSSNPNTIVTQGSVSFGNVGAGATITSTDTFTIRQNRTVQFNSSSLSWSFTQASAPTANAGQGQTVPVGTTATLNGTGSTDPNGLSLSYQWTLLSAPSESNAALVNSTSPMPTLYIDKSGDYVVQLIVSDGVMSSAPAMVTISTSHTAPVANAGSNETAAEGTVVTLDGSGSVDPDGNPLTYTWSFVSKPAGSNAILSSSSAVSPTFTLDVFGTYIVRLVVADTYLTSTPSTVTITTSHTPPVASAGTSQSVPVGTIVTLDGSASTDLNGFPLTYSWSLINQPSGSAAMLANPTSVHPSFTLDVAGSYVAQLIVNDGFNNSTPATVTISTELLAPVANAGAPQTVQQGATVHLDGSASTDPNGFALTYSWTFLTKPSGSSAAFSDPTAKQPTFVADKAGTYVAQLIVNDGTFSSTPATVQITVNAQAPVANAGANQTVAVGDTVTLNGTGSTDPNSLPLTYTWTVLAAPGAMPTLNNATSATPNFVANAAGTYTLQLIVNNGIQDSSPSTVQISAIVPTLTLTTNSLTFPGQAIGTTSTAQSVTASNATAANITFSSIGATDDFASGMTTTCGSILAPGSNCSVSVVFTPTTLGTRNGTLSFNNNAASAPQTVSLTGTGTAGTATKLVIQTQPSNVVAGSPITPAITVLVEDSNGNTVTSANGTVTLSLGNNPGGATLGGTISVAAINGVATFSGVNLNKVGTGYTLIAGGAGLTPATTASFNVTPGAASKMVFSTQPSNVAAGAVINPAVVVTVQDVNGNTVTNWSSAINLQIGNNPGNATLSGTSVTVPLNGVATFANLSLNNAGNGYTLTAQSTGVTSATSNAFNVTSGAAAKLAFTVQPSNAVSQTAIAPAIQVSVEDANGNVVTTATNAITVSIGSGPTGSTLSGTVTANAVNGVATFANISLNKTGTYGLSAAASGLTSATSSSFNVTAGAATQLAFTVQPANAIAGATMSSVQVAVEDAAGNLVTTATNPVTLAIGTNPGSGTLSGTLIANAVNGIATFSNLSINNPGTGYTLSASGSGLTSAISNPFNINGTTITITPSSSLIGVGSTLNGTVTLGQPAPAGGTVVTLSSSNTANVTISPATLNFAQGQTTGNFTYTGVAAGGATLSASATGYVTGTASVNATQSLISLGSIGNVTVGQTASIPLSLGTAAPTGGLTVNLTSSNPSVATITSSVFIPAGSTVPAGNPQLTALAPGTVQVTASATGFAPNSVSVTIVPPTATITPNPIAAHQTVATTATLTLSAPAPAGGTTFTLTTDNTAIATVQSPVTVAQGSTSVQISVTGVGIGSTTLRADSPGITEATATINDTAAPTITVNNIVVGNNLESGIGISLGAAPPSNETLTLTSSDPTHILLSTSAGTVGSSSVTVQLTAGSSSVPAIYVQGQNYSGTSGLTSALTATASGYSNGTATATLYPSGIGFNNGNFATTSTSSPTNLSAYVVVLNPNNLTYYTYGQPVGPQAGAIPVAITSSDTTVGTISGSPASIPVGSYYVNSTTFHPAGAGSSTLTLTEPSGYSTPANSWPLQITATVTN